MLLNSLLIAPNPLHVVFEGDAAFYYLSHLNIKC